MSRNSKCRQQIVALMAAAIVGLPVALAQETPRPAMPAAQPMKPGEMKQLSPEEVEKLKRAAAAGQPSIAGQPNINPVPTPPVPAAGLPNALEIDSPTFDFGDIPDTEPASHQWNFKNTSDKTVKITVAASCGCTVAGLEKDTYAPGETGKITATFNPQGRNGSQTKVLTMTVIDPQGVFAQQTMTLSANVKALVTIEPPKMYLSEVDHRSGQTSKLTVMGRKPDFKINAVESNSEFIKASIGEPTIIEEKGEKLTKYELTVEVGKGAPIGNLNGQLSFTTNDEKFKVPTYFIGADVTGDVKATPPQAMLRVQSVSTGFTSQVRIDSRSGSAFNITGIEIEGRNDMKLAADAVMGEEGKFYMLTLSGYTPDQPGIVNGTIVVATDAQGGETVRVPFTAAVRKTEVTPLATQPAAIPPSGTAAAPAPAVKVGH